MTRLSVGLFAAALLICLGSVATLAYAEDDATEETGGSTDSGGDSAKDETMMEKLEDDLKETTTPTDEETNPIGTTEDADRDLY